MDFRKEFIKEIKAIKSVDTYTVFFDMLYEAVVEVNPEVKGVASYFGLDLHRYNADDCMHLGNAFGCIVMMMEEYAKKNEFYDVLGELFHVLELHNTDRGQFFTPQSMANLTASISIDTTIIKEKGIVEINEPAVGAGANILGVCNYIIKHGYNPQKVLRVTACDVDIRCVAMCYVQMVLYRIPAAIMHGDTLTKNIHKTFYTPWWRI